MKNIIPFDGQWRLYYGEHSKIDSSESYTAGDGLEKSGTNVLEAQNRENYHLWYVKDFSASQGEYTLTFEGICI